MGTSLDRTVFDTAYEENAAPWVIGEPQPAIVELERRGGIGGKVLDPGCGAGEHTILLAELGYDVLGVDFSRPAIERARANAAEHQVEARFEIADALALDGGPYDTVVDSALFHVFGPEDREKYVRSLHAVCRPGAAVHVLALADTGPGFGPEISEAVVREAFGVPGWRLEGIEERRYRGVAVGEHAAALGVEENAVVDLPAWLARATRL
ncbi:class I SAM-dependent methyltransferase [Saccharopolyspora sp. WRP15-2]|uniref:Class I SAM-dependent methyltransferase n=1 Tax=Saccharopolyspora oryzae TaxID=2997343 RepID=A0ABT4UZQ1_9PSEU|nr:class I SAM-dependent methyltransferase [Saccharopolyspora oryzae]MDA3627194.1 class I SAM-dependent methyltransferase [Saccharopolyspora oryzae]